MKIAILAWGSLIWEKRNLAIATDWVLNGPTLPLEFSRVSQSRSGALTLVIDPVYGTENPTYVAMSSYSKLDDAIDNLAKREGADRRCVGYVNCQSGESHSILLPDMYHKIRDWAEKSNADAVIWTDFPSNFDTIDKTRFSDIDDPTMPFTVDNAYTYLQGLSALGDEKAREYIKNTSPHIATELHAHITNRKECVASSTCF